MRTTVCTFDTPAEAAAFWDGMNMVADPALNQSSHEPGSCKVFIRDEDADDDDEDTEVPAEPLRRYVTARVTFEFDFTEMIEESEKAEGAPMTPDAIREYVLDDLMGFNFLMTSDHLNLKITHAP